MRSFADKRPLLQIFHGLFHCCILIYDYSFFFIYDFFFFQVNFQTERKKNQHHHAAN